LDRLFFWRHIIRVRKELYLNKQNIISKGKEYVRSFDGDVSPDISRCALIILDMQRYFTRPDSNAYIPSSDAIIPGILSLERHFRSLGLPIFYTRHINNNKNAGMMGKWWNKLISEDNPDSLLHERLSPKKEEIFNKSQYDAFLKTDLEESLRMAEINKVMIAGVMTHLCCETTARSAFCRGFEVLFCGNATSTYNEDFHKASLLNLSHGFAKIIDIYDII